MDDKLGIKPVAGQWQDDVNIYSICRKKIFSGDGLFLLLSTLCVAFRIYDSLEVIE